MRKKPSHSARAPTVIFLWVVSCKLDPGGAASSARRSASFRTGGSRSLSFDSQQSSVFNTLDLLLYN